MNNKLKKRLKKKIWIISTIILLVYVTILILNPTILTALLPIIIPTFVLTVGLPSYAIFKYVKEISEEKAYSKTVKDDSQSIEQKHELEKKVIESSEEHIFLETDYEPNIYQEDKPKIKTKGTIHH